MSKNIFTSPDNFPKEFEYFQPLIETDNLLIEKIVSTGQSTPVDQWLEQDRDEWVILLQGKAVIRFEDDTVNNLNPGDYLFIQKNTKHRVESTSADPECIWIAVHF
ncbi:MAG TPA: cupin domain-containing protein [Ignavibacteria bacterium]|nr:cupin domain-containing protein [Ignavibacteria bacterium]